MKLVAIAASALILSASSAFAGGFGGHNHNTAPQFATSSALNLALQVGTVSGYKASSLEQISGAAAEAINKSNCGCLPGSQTAHAGAKNVSIQFGKVTSVKGKASLSQTAVATSVAKNIRGY